MNSIIAHLPKADCLPQDEVSRVLSLVLVVMIIVDKAYLNKALVH